MTTSGMIASALCITLFLSLGSCVYHDISQGAALSRVTKAMSKQQVISIAGRPLHDDLCGKNFGPHGGPECKRELVYGSAFGSIVPGDDMILLNDRSIVIDKISLQSP
jgi:hypothetical protein